MRVYRTDHEDNYTVLPNEMLQNHELSWLALGILAYLISLPDNNDMTVAKLEEMRKEGKVAVRAAIAELKAAGYYIKEDRHVGGKLRGFTAVYDIPQRKAASSAPQTADRQTARIQAVSDETVSPSAVKTMKVTPRKETLSPLTPVIEAADEDEAPNVSETAVDGLEGSGKGDSLSKDEIAACAPVLARIGRTVPRLSIGIAEMGPVLPLVAEWRRRGASDDQIVQAVTSWVPDRIRSAVGFVRNRLSTKMPAPLPVTDITPRLPLVECPQCLRPGRIRGLCKSCQTEAATVETADVADDPAARHAAELRLLMGWKRAG